jgi:hypothetical protein
MRRIDPDEQAVAEHLKQLYESFEDSFAFEQFLKGLLIEMGLQDVTVTRKSNDGGIDLTAVRPGLDALSRLDEVAYKVQAKRYAPERSVRIETLRALRGVVSHHQKGLFITTGKFPPRAEQFAAARHRPDATLRLAAVAAGVRKSLGTQATASHKTTWAAMVDSVRSMAGSEADRLWAEGVSMPLERAMQYALESAVSETSGGI